MILHKRFGDACTQDCANNNSCTGYVACERCGVRFCVYDLNDAGLCADCAIEALIEDELEDDEGKE